jgi:hypothetical protein
MKSAVHSRAEKQGATTLATAWLPVSGMGLDEWVSTGRKFGTISRCSQWWIGDWIRFGNAQWGEKYAEAAKITRYDVGTLRNMAYVASQVHPSLRSDKLSFSHHVLLAPLTDSEKRVWIDRAIGDRLSVADLRLELRAQGKGASEAVERGDETDHGLDAVERGAESAAFCPHCGGII